MNRIETYHSQLVEEKQKKIFAGLHKSPELAKAGFPSNILKPIFFFASFHRDADSYVC